MGVKSHNDEVAYPLFIRHHAHFNIIIKSTAARLDIGYVDNAEDFTGNPDYFLDFVHYSRAGVELLARNYENVIFRT